MPESFLLSLPIYFSLSFSFALCHIILFSRLRFFLLLTQKQEVSYIHVLLAHLKLFENVFVIQSMVFVNSTLPTIRSTPFDVFADTFPKFQFRYDVIRLASIGIVSFFSLFSRQNFVFNLFVCQAQSHSEIGFSVHILGFLLLFRMLFFLRSSFNFYQNVVVRYVRT